MIFELVPESPVRSGGRARIATGRKLTGQKPALKLKEVMAMHIRLQMADKIANSPSSISGSTASYEGVIWSDFGWRMWPPLERSITGPPLYRRRPGGQFPRRSLDVAASEQKPEEAAKSGGSQYNRSNEFYGGVEFFHGG